MFVCSQTLYRYFNCTEISLLFVDNAEDAADALIGFVSLPRHASFIFLLFCVSWFRQSNTVVDGVQVWF